MRRRIVGVVWRRVLVSAVTVVGAATALASCGGGSASPASTPLTVAQATRIADRLLPPSPSPADADVMSPACSSAEVNGPRQLPPVTNQWRAADGIYYRRFGGVMVEESTVPFSTSPTFAQRRKAAAFVARVRAVMSARGWSDPANVVRDGFRPMLPCSSHYVNVANVFGAKAMDPERPQFVVLYAGADHRLHLAGVMFLTPTPTAIGAQPFGTLAVWHYHEISTCMVGGMIEVPQESTPCPAGSQRYYRTPAMLHVTITTQPFDPRM